jgi:mono/diheme cytochrome c family protein
VRFALFAALLVSSSFAIAAGDPQFSYRMECQGCHAADGSGTVASVPSLKDHVAEFLTVAGGREFLAQVPGAAQAPLDDAALADVLNWILREFGPAGVASRYPAYTAEEVARLRKTPLTNVAAARARLVRQISRAASRTAPGTAARSTRR